MTTTIEAPAAKATTTAAYCAGGCQRHLLTVDMVERPVKWEPSRKEWLCPECLIAESKALVELVLSTKSLQEADEERQRHIAACDWCYRNQGVQFLGGLLAACAARKKAEAARGSL